MRAWIEHEWTVCLDCILVKTGQFEKGAASITLRKGTSKQFLLHVRVIHK
jgi:hypothetical protein